VAKTRGQGGVWQTWGRTGAGEKTKASLENPGFFRSGRGGKEEGRGEGPWGAEGGRRHSRSEPGWDSELDEEGQVTVVSQRAD